MFVSDNGYLITASTGSRFIKIWKVELTPDRIDKTEVNTISYISSIEIESNHHCICHCIHYSNYSWLNLM